MCDLKIKTSFPPDCELLQGKTISVMFSASSLGPNRCLAWSRMCVAELSKKIHAYMNVCLNEYMPECIQGSPRLWAPGGSLG